MIGGMIIIMRHYMNRHITPPQRVTSHTWGPHLRVNRPLVTKVWGRGCRGGSDSASYQHPFPPPDTQPRKTEWTVTSSKIARKLSHHFYLACFFIFSWIVLTKSSAQRHGQRRLEFTQPDQSSFYRDLSTLMPHTDGLSLGVFATFF